MDLACSRHIRGWSLRFYLFFWLRLGSAGFAQNLEHDRAAGGTLAFNGFAPIFHSLFHAIGDFFFGFALNAISFGHKNFTIRAACPNGRNKVTNAA